MPSSSRRPLPASTSTASSCGAATGRLTRSPDQLINSQTILGIVPGGSGDGLAHSLGLPRDVAAATLAALTGPARGVDVGYFGDRHFLNVAGAGFDAEVAARFNRRTTRGVRGYVAECLKGVWTYRCSTYDVRADEMTLAGPRFVVAFANGREYGNGLVLVPNADPTDGRLDVVAVADGSPLTQFWRARRLAWRRLILRPGCTVPVSGAPSFVVSACSATSMGNRSRRAARSRCAWRPERSGSPALPWPEDDVGGKPDRAESRA